MRNPRFEVAGPTLGSALHWTLRSRAAAEEIAGFGTETFDGWRGWVARVVPVIALFGPRALGVEVFDVRPWLWEAPPALLASAGLEAFEHPGGHVSRWADVTAESATIELFESSGFQWALPGGAPEVRPMAEADWTYLRDGLDVAGVQRGVTAGIARPPGGGQFLFGFNSLAAVRGAVALFVNLPNFAPMAKGSSLRGCVQRGVGGGPTGASPYLFLSGQGLSVNDRAYMLGLSDEDPHRIVLRKGALVAGIPSGAGPGVLLASTETFAQGTWLHLRLDVVVNPNGDVVLNVFRNDLERHPLNTPPNWEPIAGMPPFVDDVLGVNSGSLPLTSGRGGFGFAVQDVTRRAYFDSLELSPPNLMDAFTTRLGTSQGRVADVGFVLGSLEPGRDANLVAGDFVEVAQQVDVTAIDVVRVRGRFRDGGGRWELSVLVDGRRAGGLAGRARAVRDLGADVSSLSGVHEIAVRLEFVGP